MAIRTWTGGTSNNMDVAANWGGVIPTLEDCAIISGAGTAPAAGTCYARKVHITAAGTATDGYFYGEVINEGTLGGATAPYMYGVVINTGTIVLAICCADVINGSYGTINGGDFYCRVVNTSVFSVILGGNFYGRIVNAADATAVTGGVYFGGVVGIAPDSGTLYAPEATSLLDLVNGVETSLTLRQALRVLFAFAAGKSTDSGATYRNLANSKDRIAATLNASGERTAVVLDLT